MERKDKSTNAFEKGIMPNDGPARSKGERFSLLFQEEKECALGFKSRPVNNG
jgi:hypothetical protein